MCGIFGLLSLRGQLDPIAFGVPNETGVLRHRGPDDWGYYLDESVYLAQRRLSIIDLAGGKQPIFNEDQTKCVIFNGEIFNYQEIREDLLGRGHVFSTNSDTETIIHAYEQWGEQCLEKFRGMFAFVIWDSKKKELFAARDRLGIKPFFYAIQGDIFYFASEMKAILQYDHFPREIDPTGLASYFSLSYIPAPYTVFKNIRKLLPGHILKIRNGHPDIRQYWDLSFQPDYSQTESYFIDGLMGLLEESVKLRMISDVPIGAFLSGGVDSGAVVAMMTRYSTLPVKTFTMGFGGERGGYLDERSYAREIAAKYRTDHKEYEVKPDIHEILDDIVVSFDEPFADSSTIPSYYVSKVTRQNVKVALSGLGGDELFGGYERYLGFRFSEIYNKIPKFMREALIRQAVERLPERADGHYTVNHLKRFVRSASLPHGERYFQFNNLMTEARKGQLFSNNNKFKDGFDECRDMFIRCYDSKNATEPMDRAFYCDFKMYLPEDILACTDRMSMRHSLEVRVPFLDHKFVEFGASIPSEMKVSLWQKKRILKKAVSSLLPPGVLNHRKQGFDAPISQWLHKDLKSLVSQELSEKNLSEHGFFNYGTVRTILDDHYNYRQLNDKIIWALVIFQKWFNSYFM